MIFMVTSQPDAGPVFVIGSPILTIKVQGFINGKNTETTVTKENLDTLNYGKWLDSRVIDAYLSILTRDRAKKGEILLMSGENEHEDYKKEKMKDLIKKYSIIVIPSWLPSHWSMLIMNNIKTSCKLFNSQSSNKYNTSILAPFTEEYKLEVTDYSQQCNNDDCGVYCCFAAKCTLENFKCTLDCFNAKKFREEIKQTILGEK